MLHNYPKAHCRPHYDFGLAIPNSASTNHAKQAVVRLTMSIPKQLVDCQPTEMWHNWKFERMFNYEFASDPSIRPCEK